MKEERNRFPFPSKAANPLTVYVCGDCIEAHRTELHDGGSEALPIDNGDIKALAVFLCTYSPLYEKTSVLRWAAERISRFRGDLVLFANHSAEIYPELRDLIVEIGLTIPALFIHGHNHGDRTGTRDAWGMERDGDHLPCWLQSDMRGDPVFSIFELHRGVFSGKVELGGFHSIHEGSAGDNTVSRAKINYRSRV